MKSSLPCEDETEWRSHEGIIEIQIVHYMFAGRNICKIRIEKPFPKERFFNSVIELVWQANLIQTQKSQRHLFCPRGSKNWRKEKGEIQKSSVQADAPDIPTRKPQEDREIPIPLRFLCSKLLCSFMIEAYHTYYNMSSTSH